MEATRTPSEFSITLPNDEELVARLRHKLAEYYARLVRDDRQYKHPAQQMWESVALGVDDGADRCFKAWLLEALLRDGFVEQMPFFEAFTAQEDYAELAKERIVLQAFADAWIVIKNYAEGRLASNVGGSGLPELTSAE